MGGKVLFTASTFSHILNFHLPYLGYFQKKGWEVHVACAGGEEEIPGADRVIPLPFEKDLFSPRNLEASARIRELVRRERYDLISAHTSLAAFFTRLAVKGMRERPRVVVISHGYLFDGDTPALKRTALSAAERLTAPQTDLLLTMNRWDHEYAKKHRLGKDVVNIPGMGVDFTELDRFPPEAGAALRRQWSIPAGGFLMVYPAEFSERKSQQVLIRAMSRLPEHCYLALPGSGALLESCRALADGLGLTGRVLFPGQVRGMGPWYAAADAAVSASRSEGLPFNLMEAMHFGLPAAVSRVKGHTDLVEDGVSGLLYPYGDADACAEAIRTLLDHPETGALLGRNARERAESFSLERVFPTVTALYEAALKD